MQLKLLIYICSNNNYTNAFAANNKSNKHLKHRKAPLPLYLGLNSHIPRIYTHLMQLLFVLEDAIVKKLAFLAQLFAKLYTEA